MNWINRIDDLLCAALWNITPLFLLTAGALDDDRAVMAVGLALIAVRCRLDRP